jgi:PilZ domain-containing protein
MGQTTAQTAVIVPVAEKERRAARRVKISRPILARPSDPKYDEEVQNTLNTSRDGLYFATRAKHYHVGMRLSVTLGYSPSDPCNSASFGEVVRIDRLEDGRFGIAVQIRLS